MIEDVDWAKRVASDQKRAARVLSFDNYVALRELAYGMAHECDVIAHMQDAEDVAQHENAFDVMAHRFAEGYAEVSEYASLADKLDKVSATSVYTRLVKGVSQEDAANLDAMLRYGMLEGIPFKQRMVFVESDIAHGTKPRVSELRRWVTEELENRLAEREVDVKWGVAWPERADALVARRREYGLNGDEDGIDPNLAEMLDYGRPAGMIEVEAFGVVRVARENFNKAYDNIKALMARHPDVFDDAFVRSCEHLVQESCARQDKGGIMVSTGAEDRVLSLMELDLSLHPEKYGKQKDDVGVQLSFDFDDLDVESTPAMEDWGEFDV